MRVTISTCRRRGWVAALGVWLALVSIQAPGQSRPEQPPEVLLSLDVGFNTAYRNRTWTPVDVTVLNELSDMDGWVEVRTFSRSGDIQSPIYRMAGTFPKDSQKRFSLKCYLRDAGRIEAWIYDGDRVAVDVPAYVQLQPIDDEDLLILILDDDAANFGFLYASVQPDSGTIRLHRHTLITQDLHFLPTFQKAYESFDAVIVGEIEPARVPASARRFIAQYTRDGGTLIVQTGAFAQRYRNSWIAPLLGVTIGEVTTMTGAALAAEVFEGEDRSGARNARTGDVAALTPIEAGVKQFGSRRTLATARPLGRGQVVTIAVDATSRILQDTAGYKQLWRQLVTARKPAPVLHVDRMAEVAGRGLPNLSGVTIRPLSSVMIYLLLYLGIGVVGNWLFWNFMKRREMAWVCLVLFSVGFTVYAMASGRAGWAKSAEMHQIDVIHLPLDRQTADYHSIAGVLTARTSRYDGPLDQEDLLAREPTGWGAFQPGMGFGMQQPGLVRPYRFIQEPAPVIENFRIGASELRLMHLEGSMPIGGTVDGTVNWNGNRIAADLTDTTGLPIAEAMLYVDGQFYKLNESGNRWTLAGNSSRNRIAAPDPNQLMYGGVFYGGPQGQRNSQHGLKRSLQSALLSDENYALEVDAGPYFIGWLEQPSGGSFKPEGELLEKTSLAVLVAELDLARNPVDGERGQRLYTTFGANNLRGQPWQRMPDGPVQAWTTRAQHFYARNLTATPQTISIRIPPSMQNDLQSELLVDVLWSVDGSGLPSNVSPPEVALHLREVGASGGISANPVPNPAGRSDFEMVAHDSFDVNQQTVQRKQYRIGNWRALLQSGSIENVQLVADYEIQAEGETARWLNRRQANIGRMNVQAWGRYTLEAANTEAHWEGWH